MKKTLSALLLTACVSINYPQNQHFDPNGNEIVFIEKDGCEHNDNIAYYSGWKVYYDPVEISKFPKEYQAFIFYHEIAHIRLNHRNLILAGSQKELNADCYAVKGLITELEFSDRELGVILKTAEADKKYSYERFKNLKSCIQDNLD